MTTLLLSIVGGFFGYIFIFKVFFIYEIRVPVYVFQKIYEQLDKYSVFVVKDEVLNNIKCPAVFKGFFSLNGHYFLLEKNERILQAGFASTDSVAVLTCFRWHRKKIVNFIQAFEIEEEKISVQILDRYSPIVLGYLSTLHPPLLEKDLWQDIENEVAEVVAGKKNKTGAILYGSPGMGKTWFVKYLAVKYKLPVKIIHFEPKNNNTDIAVKFSSIGKNCIVLLEDFDAVFDKRVCTIGGDNKSIEFTFDAVLNGLDGIYNDYEKVIFIMTANDINKIDDSLINRPSRFRFVRNFRISEKDRENFLRDWHQNLPAKKEHNLDQLCQMKSLRESGISLQEALQTMRF